VSFLARVLTLAFAVVALAACPRHTRKTLVPDVPTTGSAQARTRFADAKAKFLRDGTSGDEFIRIADEFPEDPIVPWAQLYAGIAAVKERKFDVAAKSLKSVIDADANPGLTQRAELFLGIAKNYQGDANGALALLRRTEKAIEDDNERTEYLAALAYATAQSERPLAALPIFDQLAGRVSPTERAVILDRVEEIVGAADPNVLKRLFDELDDRKGPSMAAIATRLAITADEAGNAAEAQKLRDAAGPARAAFGLPKTIGEGAASATSGSGDAKLIGAVMPLGGKSNRVAEAAVAGLGMAAGVSDGNGIAAVEVRAATEADASAQAVDDLAHANVIAIVGPIDGASVDAAGGRAEGLGVPLLTLAPRPEERTTGKYVFHMWHSAEARARVLAQRSLAKGVKKLAVLAPDSGYGKAVTAAFVDELGKGGGTIVVKVLYPPDTKSFATSAAKLTGDWDGVFVPEQADRLGLITPALAATGKIPKPVGTKKVIGGRPVLLLSTAEGLTGAYLTDAGRHSEGALFAPGYYPDDQDPLQKAFLDRFIAAFGRAPGAVEAYAYDAAQLAASAGGGGRAALAAALSRGQLPGLTGTISFDAEHRRSDPGVLYTVVEETGGVFAIRVAK
jgi:ABC-type branched-subunit amino acid transport system substrate-binding protein